LFFVEKIAFVLRKIDKKLLPPELHFLRLRFLKWRKLFLGFKKTLQTSENNVPYSLRSLRK